MFNLIIPPIANLCKLIGSPVIGSTHDPLVVESDTAYQFLMPLQSPQTRSTLYVPQPTSTSEATALDRGATI